MAAVSSLRRWLRRTPQPRKLRVDGRKVDVASGVNCWAVTEETVLAMAPKRIEALDGSGLVLRAISLDDDADDATDGEPKPKSESELCTLARLLNAAHDAGATRHAAAYELAFTENTKLVGILAARLGGLEKAWQRAMQDLAQAQADAIIAESSQNGDDPAGSAIANMIGAAAAHGLANANANGAAKNGAAKPATKGKG